MIAHNGALIMKLFDPEPIRSAGVVVMPAKIQGQDVWVCRHTKENVEKLHKAGFSAPALPIDREWQYTGRFDPMSHQRKSVEFLLTNFRAFVLNDMGCVDADTEYLSPTGWKRIADYQAGKVGQYHPGTGTVEFVEPKSFVKKPCDQMYRFKTTRGVDQKLSAEHRVLWVNQKEQCQVSSAAEIAAAQDKLKIGWRGRFITTFIPLKNTRIPLTDEQLRVQIAVIADGYIQHPNTKWCVVRVKKERKIKRLREALWYAGIEYQETKPEYVGAEGFSIFKFYAPRADKEFNEIYWQADTHQLAIIADEVVHWDGSERKSEAKEFFSTSKLSADFIQYVFTSTGKTASIRQDIREDGSQCWVVHASIKQLIGLAGITKTGEKTNPISIEPTIDGFKYCFEVPSTFLILRRNGCIFASGNTGKTASVIWACEYLLQKGLIKRILIVCPLSVMGVWTTELFNVAPHRTAVVLHGVRAKRLELLKQNTEFVIINHDGLSTIYENLKYKFDVVVGDEASVYRNPATKRYKHFKDLVNGASRDDTPVPRLWLLTGTPAPTAPTDVWGLIKLVQRKNFAMSRGAFKELTMRKINMFIWIPKKDASETIYKLMKPAIRFRKEDCLDLPPLTFVNRECEFSTEQKKAFEEMRKVMIMEKATGGKISAANAAVRLTKLIQIACGVVKDNDSAPHYLEDKNRLALLEEIIEEAGGKAIIFVPYIAVMQRIKKYLEDIKISCEVVDGSVGATAREHIFSQFQNGTLPVIIAHPKTAAHGLNLTASACVIWYAPIFSAELFDQGNARIHRPGQTQNCTVVKMGACILEWKLYDALDGKLRLQDTILREYEELVR